MTTYTFRKRRTVKDHFIFEAYENAYFLGYFELYKTENDFILKALNNANYFDFETCKKVYCLFQENRRKHNYEVEIEF